MSKRGQSERDVSLCAGDGPAPIVCPIPPMWSPWTPWSACNPNCGNGKVQFQAKIDISISFGAEIDFRGPLEEPGMHGRALRGSKMPTDQ